mgnify:CR=1 FL=1
MRIRFTSIGASCAVALSDGIARGLGASANILIDGKRLAGKAKMARNNAAVSAAAAEAKRDPNQIDMFV